MNLIPWPKEVETHSGALAVRPDARIVATTPELAPLARLVADEIDAALDVSLAAGVDEASKAGDVVLRVDNTLGAEQYVLDVTDRVDLRGGSYAAAAMATATLLQATTANAKGRPGVPRITVRDEPFRGYRGVMVDVARKWHAPAVLRQLVILCRLYKIRYLHLHLTDDQAFTFPSLAYPQLGEANTRGIRRYTLEELRDLEEFARVRGVRILPELDVPGHASAMTRAMPELLATPENPPVLNFVDERVIDVLDTLVGEMCDVFRETPYFHIGADEVRRKALLATADFARTSAELGLDGEREAIRFRELYRRFIVRMNEVVRGHGRRMIVWEGFRHSPRTRFEIPRDVIVMEFEMKYSLPARLVEQGFDVINACWTPLYLTSAIERDPRTIHDWDLWTFGLFGRDYDKVGWRSVEPTERIIGGQMCSWGRAGETELPGLRPRAPVMSERVWNPDAGRGWEDLRKRCEATDALLDRLVAPWEEANGM